ncbi:MAG: hypothetical protein Kow0092_10230 [Deferrisomatales bacterium]
MGSGFAVEAEIHPVAGARFAVDGATGTVPGIGALLPALEVDGVCLGPVAAALLDLGFLPRCLDAQGLLGVQSVFHRSGVAFDLAGSGLELSAACSGRPDGSGWLPLWSPMGRALASTRILLQPPGALPVCKVLVSLDTGGCRSAVTRPVVERTGRPAGRPWQSAGNAAPVAPPGAGRPGTRLKSRAVGQASRGPPPDTPRTGFSSILSGQAVPLVPVFPAPPPHVNPRRPRAIPSGTPAPRVVGYKLSNPICLEG